MTARPPASRLITAPEGSAYAAGISFKAVLHVGQHGEVHAAGKAVGFSGGDDDAPDGIVGSRGPPLEIEVIAVASGPRPSPDEAA